ncbi:hypothetical protein K1719_003737 [Acacia pycnantha]|nr:hypothetical protein K1719_003737 [Acacia pycnantha]
MRGIMELILGLIWMLKRKRKLMESMFMVVILEITMETNVSKGNSGTCAGIGQSSSNPNKDVSGPAAKLLYQKENAKESSQQLMYYASGRHNPFLDPASPISGASCEHQRLKLINRQRRRTEILSFDGNILRSGLHQFDINAWLQACQPISLISEAAAASASAIK